jgi:hypothetical protein
MSAKKRNRLPTVNILQSPFFLGNGDGGLGLSSFTRAMRGMLHRGQPTIKFNAAGVTSRDVAEPHLSSP